MNLEAFRTHTSALHDELLKLTNFIVVSRKGGSRLKRRPKKKQKNLQVSPHLQVRLNLTRPKLSLRMRKRSEIWNILH